MTNGNTTPEPHVHSLGNAPLHGLKGIFPFRLGATSFVFPDDVLPNVEALAEHVDDIEILSFESADVSPLPARDTLANLCDLARRHELSYTVHLPLDADIGSLEAGQRADSTAKILTVMRHMEILRPIAFILHCPIAGNTARHWQQHASAWRSALARSLDALAAAGVDTSQLCVETLDYPIDWIADLVTEHGLSICLDIGHLLLHDLPVEPIVRRYGQRIRVVHMHGIEDGKDHCAVSDVDACTREMIFSAPTHDGVPARVVTIEVFNRTALVESLGCLSRLLT